MKSCYTNPRFLSYVLSTSEQKQHVLENVIGRQEYFCGGDELRVLCEMMEHKIVRYTITATQAKMTICWDVDAHQVIRQPRGLKAVKGQRPIHIDWDFETTGDELHALVQEHEDIMAAAATA